ncbi:MAG: Ferrochelatase [Acidimicrobiales bacterium]|jgi:ferrochelatase|nr:Ferrochelatase [Acidimicrobiales bacterium]
MKEAVLLMAYGTPARPEDVEAYYTDIRRGRPPTPEQLADLVRRYDAIGGISPLAARTEAQRVGLQAALDERAPERFEVVLGFKHVAPFIEDTVEDLRARGIDRIVALVLAPHYSALSVGEYLRRTTEAAGDIDVATIESWATEPAYIDFLTSAVQERLVAMPEGTKVVFTAHSLPKRVEAMGDPYVAELRSTAQGVADRLGLAPWAQWATAWQSAGRTPEPWLGPDVLQVIDDLAGTGRATGLLIVPCGFVADHLEVLYDLDIEATAAAGKAGLPFARTAVANDDPGVLAALADRVLSA